jgi:hypothetical protein
MQLWPHSLIQSHWCLSKQSRLRRIEGRRRLDQEYRRSRQNIWLRCMMALGAVVAGNTSKSQSQSRKP